MSFGLVWILERAITYWGCVSIFQRHSLDSPTWDLELQESHEDINLPLMLECGLQREIDLTWQDESCTRLLACTLVLYACTSAGHWRTSWWWTSLFWHDHPGSLWSERWAVSSRMSAYSQDPFPWEIHSQDPSPSEEVDVGIWNADFGEWRQFGAKGKLSSLWRCRGWTLSGMDIMSGVATPSESLTYILTS